MEIEYTYWIVEYISCEGNNRWSTWRAPVDFIEYDMWNHIQIGGCGDDISEIVSIEQTYCDDPYEASYYIWKRKY